MADEEASGAATEDAEFVGVSHSYANAANETDVPRIAEEDKELYERFGEVPEPEKTSFYEGVHAPKEVVEKVEEDPKSAADTAHEPSKERPSVEPQAPKSPSTK